MTRLTKEVAKSAETERNEMRIALAGAITVWSSLEDMLAMLLSSIIGDRTGKQYGIRAFFTPIAYDVRLNLVSILVGEYARNHNQQGLLQDLWESIHTKINNVRRTRNKLAHGSIRPYQRGNDRMHVRLTGSFFEVIEPTGSKQLPGMSLHDVQQSMSIFAFRCSLVVAYTNLIQLFEHNPSNVEAFNEKAEYLRQSLVKGTFD